jgi:hypothetical protein
MKGSVTLDYKFVLTTGSLLMIRSRRSVMGRDFGNCEFVIHCQSEPRRAPTNRLTIDDGDVEQMRSRRHHHHGIGSAAKTVALLN